MPCLEGAVSFTLFPPGSVAPRLALCFAAGITTNLSSSCVDPALGPALGSACRSGRRCFLPSHVHSALPLPLRRRVPRPLVRPKPQGRDEGNHEHDRASRANAPGLLDRAQPPSPTQSLGLHLLPSLTRPDVSIPYPNSCPQNGQDIRSEFVAKLPEDDLFAHLTLPVHRCALVSSSGAMLGSGLGPRIDSHHLVMRLNNAPVKGFEKDVGASAPPRLPSSCAVILRFALPLLRAFPPRRSPAITPTSFSIHRSSDHAPPHGGALFRVPREPGRGGHCVVVPREP